MSMTSAEFKCLRESMGLTTKWLAARWDVNEVSVQRWERNRTLPDSLAEDMARLKMQFDGEVEHAVETGGDYFVVPRNDRFHTMDDMPAAWHHMIAERVRERTGVRILFTDDEQDPDDVDQAS